MNNELIIITYYGRSGSYFVHSLLDGHPDVISLPPIFVWWVHDLKRLRLDLPDADQAYAFFVERYGNLVHGNGYCEQFNLHPNALSMFYHFNMDFGFEEQEFKRHFMQVFKHFQKESDDNYLVLFYAIHYAFQLTLEPGSTISDMQNRKIVFQLHNPWIKEINWFAERFSSIKYLQSVRSPLVGLRSILRAKMENENWFCSASLLRNLVAGTFFGGTVYPRKNVKHGAVKLEDLHNHSNRTLHSLADFLEIPFNETMTQSSFGKNPWGNVLGRQHIKGFSPESTIIDISDYFPEEDALYLSSIMKNRYDKWGYDMPGEYVEDAQDKLRSHIPLIEYIPSCQTFEKAQEAHKKQINIIRSEHLQFFYQHLPYFNTPLAELV